MANDENWIKKFDFSVPPPVLPTPMLPTPMLPTPMLPTPPQTPNKTSAATFPTSGWQPVDVGRPVLFRLDSFPG